ncbi:MAG: BLUF domain-containing protein [Thiothrix sp.]|uniref:BLUF domain-containing protein n=1 Tax=Thiothrix sp. TaxID=1032 RepID=UPI00262D5077|nr:BLUF domain-containing protein [Thiothrix sp.]MDD5391962.1 BLUF domain-containing protein [Thiothrix sp.]
MFFLVYASSADELFSQAELLELLAKARENNTRLGVSGMLLYKDGNFMQVLEGEEQTVRALYTKISHDLRHRGLLTLLQGEQAERQFPDWSMGFHNLDGEEALAIPGYSDFLNTSLMDKTFFANPTRCQKLLAVFKRSM